MHLLYRLLFEEQIVERAKRTVFLHLKHRHFLAVHGQLDEAAPAVELMRTYLADVFRIAIRTSHHNEYLPIIPSL
jgi:hypothetical protein